MFNLILFGPPGSGKGTQSEKIIERFGLKHISTGDLLRLEKAAKTELGLEAAKYMDNGKLVPDEVMIGIISSVMDANPSIPGFLFDGYPRTVAQAEAMDHLLELKGHSITRMIALTVREDELVRRLLMRGQVSERPDDRNTEVISARINEYHKKTKAVADYYAKADKVVYLDGEGSIEEIFERITKEIDSCTEKQFNGGSTKT